MSAHRGQKSRRKLSAPELLEPLLTLREWKQQLRGLCFQEVPLTKNNKRGENTSYKYFPCQRNIIAWQVEIYSHKCQKFPSYDIFLSCVEESLNTLEALSEGIPTVDLFNLKVVSCFFFGFIVCLFCYLSWKTLTVRKWRVPNNHLEPGISSIF